MAAALAALVRVIAALWYLPEDAMVRWDIQSYRLVAERLNSGGDVYDLISRYPYLPLQMWVFAAAERLEAITPLSFLFWVKLPAIVADTALTALVGGCAAALGRRTLAPALAFTYALNPVSLLVTGFHGQFDAVPTALLVSAWALITFRQGRWPVLASGLLFGLAVADKTWPAMVAPVLLWRLDTGRRRLGFLAAAVAPVAACLALYEAIVPGGARHAIAVASGYHGVAGVWGYSGLMVELSPRIEEEALKARALEIAPRVMAVAMALGFFAAARLRRDIDRMALLIAVLYVAAAGWGTHWLLWLMPVALIGARRWAAVYAVAAGLYALTVYIAFGGILWGFTLVTNSLQPVGWLFWVGALLWGGLTAGVFGIALVALGNEAAMIPGVPGAARRGAAVLKRARQTLVSGGRPARLWRRSPARAEGGNAP